MKKDRVLGGIKSPIGWQCAKPNIVQDIEYRPLKVLHMRWVDLPQLQSHFPYAAPPSNNAEKYPYIETVHPEDTLSIDVGKRKRSKKQPCKGQGRE